MHHVFYPINMCKFRIIKNHKSNNSNRYKLKAKQIFRKHIIIKLINRGKTYILQKKYI